MIRDMDHLRDLMVKVDMVLADGNERTVFEILERLIGRENPLEKSPPDHIEYLRYSDYCQRNGFTPTDVVMALQAGKFPKGWRQENIGLQVFTRRTHAHVG